MQLSWYVILDIIDNTFCKKKLIILKEHTRHAPTNVKRSKSKHAENSIEQRDLNIKKRLAKIKRRSESSNKEEELEPKLKKKKA